MFRKLDLFIPSGDGLGPLKGANLNHWAKLVLSKEAKRIGISPFTRGRKHIQFPKRCVLYFFRITG
jgi:hypothetical protein